ncbi:MAG: sulfite exporter TauE/SafE family protein [Bacillota bacterium]
MDGIVDLAYGWYTVLSQWSNLVGQPLQRLLGSQNIPGLSALLLGLLGGLAPCQVTANAGAIAYVTESSRRERPLWPTVGAFLLGKILVYGALGFLAAMLGWKLPIPVMAALRKLTGPILILMGLSLLGWLRWRGPAGERVTEWLRERLPRRGSPAFWLGVAFSLGFCPTMAMIFFGGLVPLVLQSQAGLILSIVFAVGTAVPVILWAAALSASREAGRRWVRKVRHADRYVRLAAALLFLLLGLNDLLLYWFL